MAATQTSTHLRGDDKITVSVHQGSNSGWIDIAIGTQTFVIFASLEQIEMMGCDIINAVGEIRHPT